MILINSINIDSEDVTLTLEDLNSLGTKTLTIWKGKTFGDFREEDSMSIILNADELRELERFLTA